MDYFEQHAGLQAAALLVLTTLDHVRFLFRRSVCKDGAKEGRIKPAPDGLPGGDQPTRGKK